MAAIDLALDVPKTQALSTNAQEFAFPANAREFLIHNLDASIVLRYAFAGTDGAPLPGDYERLGAGVQIVLAVPGVKGQSRNLSASSRKIFVAAASSTPSVTITALRGS